MKRRPQYSAVYAPSVKWCYFRGMSKVSLEENTRAYVRDVVFGGVSHAEIALMLDIGKSTVTRTLKPGGHRLTLGFLEKVVARSDSATAAELLQRAGAYSTRTSRQRARRDK